MFYINVPDMNDSIGRITLSEKDYYIRFTWNSTYDYWSFGIYETDMTPILTGSKIVPLSPLTYYYQTITDFPDGIFGAFTTLDNIGRNDFVDNKAKFAYIPNSELKGWKPYE